MTSSKQVQVLAMMSVLAGALSLGGCGEAGDDGKSGTDGEDGAPGDDGDDGAPGEDGAPGSDGEPGDDGMNAPSLRFAPVGFPMTTAEKQTATATAKAWVNGQDVEMGGYKTIQRSGNKPQADVDSVFGRMTDKMGNALKVGGDDYVSSAADFSSLLQVGSKVFSVTHFESRPGGMYVTELAQSATGELTAISTKPVDFSAWDGLWVPCAGSVTPWNTHLGGEEYPTNARAYNEVPDLATFVTNATYSGTYSYDRGMYRYFGLDIDTDVDNAGAGDGIPDNLTLAQIKAAFNPYAYGYPVEVTVTEAGAATPAKHFAMGRMALELAYVMPDKKTVYMTDDGTNVGFFMYITDVASDLSAGTLYAAKWIQTSGAGAGAADLVWISLGHATQAEVAPFIQGSSKLAFGDLFETEAPVANACSAGFKHVIAEGREECLKLKAGMELPASRLETRRYANYLGATMEFRKEEGIAFDPNTRTLFVAMSEVNNGMEDAGSKDFGGANDIRLAKNDCGAVYGLDVGPDAVIGSDYVAADWYTVIAGAPVAYPAGSPFQYNTCSVNGLANPDNVTFVHNFSTLIIGEDSGAGHQNDSIWSLDMTTSKLTRILTTPYGSETTSPYWYPNINGFAYLKAVIQHPYGEADGQYDEATMSTLAPEAAGKAAYDGYIGPFPAMD